MTNLLDRKLKSQSLGKPGSQKHRRWKNAIAWREAIVKLEHQLAMLQTLIERQARTWKDLEIPDLVNLAHSAKILN
jgi:hypothetical protein